MKKFIPWARDKLRKKEKEKVTLTPIREKHKNKKESGLYTIVIYIVFGTVLSYIIQCGLERCNG